MSIDSNIAQMHQSSADNARLQTASTQVNATIQGTASTTQTMNAATNIAFESVKTVANDARHFSKSA